jgi:hypothetical protein
LGKKRIHTSIRFYDFRFAQSGVGGSAPPGTFADAWQATTYLIFSGSLAGSVGLGK